MNSIRRLPVLTALFAALAVHAFAATEINLAHSSPAANDRLETACLAFKNYVEEKSNGEIVVSTFPASQLGAEREQLEGVQMGTIQMAALSAGPFPSLFADIMLFDIPYLFTSEEVAYEILDGAMGDRVRQKFFEQTGIRCLVFGENGFRNFTTSKTEVRKPQDMQGLKIRVMENPAHMQMIRELGGIPTPIPFSEVYTALAQGVVDGQENPVSLIESMRFYEVQKYLIMDNHLYNPYLLIINEQLYDGLTDAQKKIVDEGAALFAREERRLNQEQIKRGLETMRKAGTEIIEFTPDQIQAFRDKVQPSVIKTIKEYIDAGLVDEFLEEVRRVEASKK